MFRGIHRDDMIVGDGFTCYLAGPDVFAPDWDRRCAVLCHALAARGFHALVPENAATACVIYEANLQKIRSADWVLANLQPFRGAEPDSGTVFEVGFAAALGKPVYGYNASGSYAARVALAQGNLGGNPAKDKEGWQVEQFGLPLNLMVAVPVRIAQDFQGAIMLAQSWFLAFDQAFAKRRALRSMPGS